jgi:ribosome-associated protein
MEKIAIDTPKIMLTSFLKLAGAAPSGGAVGALIAEGRIRRNGMAETAKRRQLVPGDVIEVDGIGTYEVVAR